MLKDSLGQLEQAIILCISTCTDRHVWNFAISSHITEVTELDGILSIILDY